MPVVFARVERGAVGGTVVKIRMRLHLAVIGFMLVWFGGVSMAAFSAFNRSAPAQRVDAIPFAMLAFGVLLVCGGFFPEAIKAQRLIRNALRTGG